MGAVDKLLARMRGQRVYIDANYLIYFLDRRAPYFDLVAPIFVACDAGEFDGYTGDAAVAEVMVHPYKRKSAADIARGKAFFAREGFLTILPHDANAFDLVAQLRASSNLKMIDALHYATALQAGCRFMLTNDHALAANPSSASIEVISIASLSGE
jgi:predicted nucleic acid-binding protein